MLEWAKDKLYLRTSDEWAIDSLEADPLVHLLIGACASEAKAIYETIQESDDRILQRLLNYLLPAAFHLPQPAAAIAQAQARTTTCLLPNTYPLVFKDSEKQLTFTPLFETKVLNGLVQFIGTDSEVIDKSEVANPYISTDKVENVSKFLIGIQSSEPIQSLEDIAFYVDWTGDELEKRQLLSALSDSKWIWNEQVLKRQNGFLKESEVARQDHLDIEKQLAKRLNKQYKRHFHLITDTTSPPKVELSVHRVLQAWLSSSLKSEEEVNTVTEKWAKTEGNYIWLKVVLPYDIALTNVEKHLHFDLNHFIVVNRTLQEKDDSDTYFSSSLGLEIIEVKAKKGLFHSIKRVYNGIKNKPIPLKSLPQLIQNKDQTAYSFRMGGVGRLDSYNAWQRLSYLFSIFRKEQKLRDIFDRIGDKMSLDELHEVLDAQMSNIEAKKANEQLSQVPTYLFVNTSKDRSQLRVKIDYWITEGEAANGLKPYSKLYTESALAGLDLNAITLLTSPQGGKNSFSPTEKIQAVQDKMYRRGRIISAHDVKSLCFQKMGQALKAVDLKTYFETNRSSSNGGIRRSIEVILTVDNLDDPYLHSLAHEIELTLQEESIGIMPYKVTIVQQEE